MKLDASPNNRQRRNRAGGGWACSSGYFGQICILVLLVLPNSATITVTSTQSTTATSSATSSVSSSATTSATSTVSSTQSTSATASATSSVTTTGSSTATTSAAITGGLECKTEFGITFIVVKDGFNCEMQKDQLNLIVQDCTNDIGELQCESVSATGGGSITTIAAAGGSQSACTAAAAGLNTAYNKLTFHEDGTAACIDGYLIDAGSSCAHTARWLAAAITRKVDGSLHQCTFTSPTTSQTSTQTSTATSSGWSISKPAEAQKKI